ncbi:MAG: DUF3822 family protein [Bacteroidales bacterium]|jgi:hypothetical protein|nr:DUF3822 family protein [Bacteroidales bacterium]
MPETGGGNKPFIRATVDLLDETFDVSQIGNCLLFLQITTGSVSFCIFHTGSGKYVGLRHYLFARENDLYSCCRSVFESDELLRLKYKNCCGLWLSPRYGLVPVPLFDPQAVEKYINFTLGKATDETTLYRCMQEAQTYVVFSVPAELKNIVEAYQPATQWFHQSETFIRFVPEEKQAAFFFYGNNMDITVRQSQKLLFYNTFAVKTSEDVLYFLASVLNLHGLPLSVDIAFAGVWDESPYKSISQYVTHISEWTPDHVGTAGNFTESLLRRFFHLFYLSRCAS